MDSTENIAYDSAEEVLAEADCETRAAELQAIICGMLSAGLKVSTSDWQQVLVDVINEGRAFSKELQDLVLNMASWTSHEMTHQEALAPLLLPDDSYPAVDQVEAIAQWCQGFLLGFGLQLGDQPIESEEVKESLTDIADISQLEIAAEENEETRTALFTISEHIKVAVQVVYCEVVLKTSVIKPSALTNSETLH